MEVNSISNALFTKTQQRVLSLLYGKMGQRFYTNEIIRWADMGRGSVRRELERMVECGLLVRTQEGNQHYYQSNSHSPVHNELLGIVRKTFGLGDVIKEALAPTDDRLKLAFIYGSMAKGTDVATSDVDLMLVGHNLVYSEVLEAVAPSEITLSRVINPTIYTVEQFTAKLKGNNSFIVRVMDQPKVMIKGLIDDFRESI